MALGPIERVNFSRPAYELLTAVKHELEQDKGRQVTYSEVVEELTRHWDATRRLAADVREAKPIIEFHASGVTARETGR